MSTRVTRPGRRGHRTDGNSTRTAPVTLSQELYVRTTPIPPRPAPGNRSAARSNWRRLGSAAAATAALLVAGFGTAVDASAAVGTTATKTVMLADAAKAGSTEVTWTRSCAEPKKKGEMACNALRVTGGTTAFMRANAHANAVTPKAAADFPTGYGPSDLQDAYGLTSAAASNGSGGAHRDRRRLRRPERGLRPRRVPLVLRPVGLHHGQRLLQEGQPDRLDHLPALRRQRLGRSSLADLDMASAVCPTAPSRWSRRSPPPWPTSAPR